MHKVRLASVLCATLVLGHWPLHGQQPMTAQRLRIIPLEGNNAINFIQIRSSTPPVVEVRNENDQPLEGVAVVFTLPTAGAGATFENGQRSQAALTDFRGQAGVTRYTINDTPGRFAIEVTAKYQRQTGRTMIVQTNSVGELPVELGGRAPSRKKTWWLIAVAAAGAGTAIYFATRSSNRTISVGLGPVGLGAPR